MSRWLCKHDVMHWHEPPCCCEETAGDEWQPEPVTYRLMPTQAMIIESIFWDRVATYINVARQMMALLLIQKTLKVAEPHEEQ